MPSIKKTSRGYLVRGRDHQGKDRRHLVPTKTLADELSNQIVANRIRHRHGLHTEQERLTFGVAWDEWLARYKAGSCSKVKPTASTVQAVLERRPHLDPLNSLYLDEIDQHRLEKIGLGLVKDGHPALASRVVGLAKRVLRDAQDRDVRVNGSAFRVSFPVPQGKDARAFTWAEVELLASFVPERLRRGVLLLALTGLRVSEFCALTDSDVIFDKTGYDASSEVAPGAGRALSRSDAFPPHAEPAEGGGGKLRAGESASDSGRQASYILVRKSKTHAGVRRVYLTEYAALLVREQMLARPNREEGVAPGRRGPDSLSGGRGVRVPTAPTSRYLFPNEHGEPYDRHEIYGYISRAGRFSGLGKVRTHELRHTHVSLAASAGIPFDVVRAQLGWSERTAALMWSHYRRLFEGEAVRMVQRLDALVTPQSEAAETG